MFKNAWVKGAGKNLFNNKEATSETRANNIVEKSDSQFTVPKEKGALIALQPLCNADK